MNQRRVILREPWRLKNLCSIFTRDANFLKVTNQIHLSTSLPRDDRLAIAASLRDFDRGERGISAAESLKLVRNELGKR